MRIYTNMEALADMLSQIFEEPITADDVPLKLASLALATEAQRTQQAADKNHAPQQIEFERDYWQRKVGALLTLIEREAPDLYERACVLVNTDRSHYLTADKAQDAFAAVFVPSGEPDNEAEVP